MMSNPPNPPSRLPPSTQKTNRRKNNRRSRRRYPAPVIEFDENDSTPRASRSVDMPASPAVPIVNDSTSDPQTDKIANRTARYYGAQALAPAGSVSPCLNGTDRMRRQQVSRVREPEPVEQVYCDITALLLSEPKGKGKMNAEDVPDMLLTDSEEEMEEEKEGADVDDDFEMVESRDFSEHNGTERRWYRGFRH